MSPVSKCSNFLPANASLFSAFHKKSLSDFFCQIEVKVLNANVQNIECHHVAEDQNSDWFHSLESTTWNHRRESFLSKEG